MSRNVSLTPAKQGAAGALFAAAALWPSFADWAADAALTPAQRLLREAWCGVSPQASVEFLGHCPACWAGAAALMLAGFFVLAARSNRSVAASAFKLA